MLATSRARNNVLKALAGSTCDKVKETLTTAYKAIDIRLANYAAPMFATDLRDD